MSYDEMALDRIGDRKTAVFFTISDTTPSELATMPGDRCILQLRGLPPFYSRKYDLKQHPNFKHTAEADKKNAFDLDRLINRNRRPDLNEVCEVHEVSVPDEALVYEDEDILNYDDLDDPDAFI